MARCRATPFNLVLRQLSGWGEGYVQLVEHFGDYLAVVVCAASHHRAETAEIVGIETVVCSLDGEQCGVGIFLNCFFRVGNLDNNIFRAVENCDTVGESADVGIYVISAHGIAKSLAVTHSGAASKSAKVSETTTKRVEHGDKVGDIESGIEKNQALNTERFVFGSERRNKSAHA